MMTINSDMRCDDNIVRIALVIGSNPVDWVWNYLIGCNKNSRFIIISYLQYHHQQMTKTSEQLDKYEISLQIFAINSLVVSL